MTIKPSFNISGPLAAYGLIQITIASLIGVFLKWVPDSYKYKYYIIILFSVLFIILIFLFVYIWLYKNEILYPPSIHNKIHELQELPMIKYTKLTEVGKRLALKSLNGEFDINSEFIQKLKIEDRRGEVEQQMYVLMNDFKWCEQLGNKLRATEKGRKDIMTFVDFVYGRMAPSWYGKL